MNVIGSWHLVEDMFTQIAKFLSTEERLICMRVCRVWNRLLDTTLIWQMSYKRDFDNSPLTYSRSNPKEQYLEKVGIALHLHAKNREIQHLTSFQGVGRPFKPIGHLLIGCLQGNIVAKNLHNNVMYPCSGRPDPKATITCLATSQNNADTVRLYTGSENGALEEWDLTSQTWTRKIINGFSPITALQWIDDNTICIGFADGAIKIHGLISRKLFSFNMQDGFLDRAVLHIQPCLLDAMSDGDTSYIEGTYYSLVEGCGVVAATKYANDVIMYAETATYFAWHGRGLSEPYFYVNHEQGDIIRSNTKDSKVVQKGSPYSDAANQGFIIMGDLLIVWQPKGAFWVGATSIKIWDLTTEPASCLQTLNVDDPISEMAATGGILAAYSKESKQFHAWGLRQ